jgi:hypothetical protein
MFPVLAPELSSRILKEIIPVYLADNMRARQLDAEGVFHLLHPAPGETPVRCQIQMLEQAVPDAEAFAAGASSTGIDGALPQPIGRLAASPGGGRGRGQAGKSRKPRG